MVIHDIPLANRTLEKYGLSVWLFIAKEGPLKQTDLQISFLLSAKRPHNPHETRVDKAIFSIPLHRHNLLGKWHTLRAHFLFSPLVERP